MKSFIAKCRKCKTTLQLSAEVAKDRPTLYSERDAKILCPRYVSWRVVGGKFDGHITPMAQAWKGKWTIDLNCACGRTISFVCVTGTITEHECSAKCMGSKGFSCECSCGGINHGKSFAA